MKKKRCTEKATSIPDNSLSPSLPVEDDKSLKDHISKVISPILDKVLKETKSNPMSVGGVGSGKGKYCLYDPHNYRLYFDFDKSSFSPVVTDEFKKTEVGQETDPSVGLFPVEHRIINSTEHEYSNFMGCRIVVKQTQMEITAKRVQWHKIYMDSTNHIREQFISIIHEKDRECLNALKGFIKAFGGHSEFKILNAWCENKIMQEDSIDKIPRRMKWHGQLSKKVYNETNVEFPTPLDACNYVETRAYESVAPVVAQEIALTRKQFSEDLKDVSATMKEMAEHNRVLAENMVSHIPAIVKLGVNAEKGAVSNERLASSSERLVAAVDALGGARERKDVSVCPLYPSNGEGLEVSGKTTPTHTEPSPLLCPDCGVMVVLKGRDCLPYCWFCRRYL